jgi:hypothetical protein
MVTANDPTVASEAVSPVDVGGGEDQTVLALVACEGEMASKTLGKWMVNG